MPLEFNTPNLVYPVAQSLSLGLMQVSFVERYLLASVTLHRTMSPNCRLGLFLFVAPLKSSCGRVASVGVLMSK